MKFLQPVVVLALAQSVAALELPLEVRLDAEVGTQLAYRPGDGGWDGYSAFTRARPYLNWNATRSFDVGSQSSPTRIRLDVGSRLFADRNRNQPYNEFQLRNLCVSVSQEIWSVTAGMQEVGWGETFGVFISDLVNPRDLRDPLFTDPDWMRVSTATINAKLFVGSWRFQGVWTPVPSTTEVPAEFSGIRIRPQQKFKLNRFGKDAEYGLRAGTLLDFGLDFSVFYFRHWNRNPVFSFVIDSATGGLQLAPQRCRIHTFGLSASLAPSLEALSGWVFRGDMVYHRDGQVQETFLDPALRSDWVRGICGADWAGGDAWSCGAQFHLDYWRHEKRAWIAGRVEKGLLDNQLIPELFLIKGLGHEDFWVQPKLTWQAPYSLTLSLRADLLFGGIWRHEDRVLFCLSWNI